MDRHGSVEAQRKTKTMTYKVSDNLAEFHKLAEGFETSTYRDSGGVLTIGIGHANQDTAPFAEGDTWSERQCLDVWRADVAVAEKHANNNISVDNCPQELFDAYVDLIFNTGVVPKTLARKVNVGDFEGATEELPKWVYVNGEVVGGLVKRRMAMYAYVKGGDWEEILKYPLKTRSESSMAGFNELLARWGYEFVAKPNTSKKFALEPRSGAW